MSDFSFDNVLKAAQDAQSALIKTTPQLENAITNTKQQGLPNIAVNPGSGQMLSLLCQLVNAKNILEIGTLGGYSTIWFATSVPGVKVTSIEYDPKHHAVATENVKGLDNVEILLGAGLDVLPKLQERGTKYDFIFIDADWDNQANYFDETLKMVNSGGLIFVDNALRCMTESDEGYDKYRIINRIKADPRLEATFLPVVNTVKAGVDEAFDGFILVKVK